MPPDTKKFITGLYNLLPELPLGELPFIGTFHRLLQGTRADRYLEGAS